MFRLLWVLVGGWVRSAELCERKDRDMRWVRLTRTVFRTLTRRGKSETPLSSVSTDDSRNLRDVRSEETQSEYVDRWAAAMMIDRGVVLVLLSRGTLWDKWSNRVLIFKPNSLPLTLMSRGGFRQKVIIYRRCRKCLAWLFWFDLSMRSASW